MTDVRYPKIGQSVIYVDPVSVPHEALITYVPENFQPEWGQPWTNIVFVTTDATRTDSYGHQIERNTSVSHVSKSHAPGMYWCYADEYSAQRDADLRASTMAGR